jgi:hypothetical protein
MIVRRKIEISCHHKKDRLRKLAISHQLIGEHKALYDPMATPMATVARANHLIPNIQAELIPHAGYGLSITQVNTVQAEATMSS